MKQEGEKADPQCAQLELDLLGQVPVQLQGRGSEPQRPKRRASNGSHLLSHHMGCSLARPGLHVSPTMEPVAQASHNAQDRSPRGETEATGCRSQGTCE